MGHSQIGVVDPVTGLQAKVLPDAEADTGQAGLAVRVISGNEVVTGNVASGAADSGNPVKVGGRHNTVYPTLTDGLRADLQLDTRGNLSVQLNIGNSSSIVGGSSPADSQTNSFTGLYSNAFSAAFNESTWDRLRGNTTAALIAAGTITTQTNKVITNYNARYLEIVLNVTAATSTPTATVAISGTTASGFPFPILTGAAIVSTGVVVYRVGPGLTALTNLTVNDLVPRNILVTVTITGSVTYGVDYVLSV